MNQPRKMTEAEIDERLTPPKRYFVAQTQTTKHIGLHMIADITALLNAGIISEDFLTRERVFPSSDNVVASKEAAWVPVAQLLATAYKDQPLVTVVVKDSANNTVLLSERYHSKASARQVARDAADFYFDRHYKEFTESPPKEFLVYFKSDQCLPSVMTVQLKVENNIVYKGVIGSKYAPAEEHYPYEPNEINCRELKSPEEFPPIALDLKPPKYDPTAYLAARFRYPNLNGYGP